MCASSLGGFLVAMVTAVTPVMKKRGEKVDVWTLPAWVGSQQGTFLGLARTIHIRCMYGISGREITKYTVIYTVYIYGSGQPFTLR
jgi:hypothetical protein